MGDQNNQSNINAKDFIIGSLVGGIVGAATALFLAPKSGKELRNDLNDQAIVLKDKSTEIASKAKETSQTIAKSVQEQSSQVAGKVKNISDRFRYENNSAADALDETVEESIEEAAADVTEEVISTDVESDTEPRV